MKPILFLDFDRTLFDTEQLYKWFGDDHFSKMLGIVAGKLPAPDFASFLYADTKPFLKKMRKNFRLVILTYSVNTLFTRKKLRGANIATLVDDIIITQQDKGVEIKEYLARVGDSGWEHVFVDDAPLNIDEVKRANPDIRCIRIDRTPPKLETMHPTHLPPDATITNLTELEVLL